MISRRLCRNRPQSFRIWCFKSQQKENFMKSYHADSGAGIAGIKDSFLDRLTVSPIIIT
jgi:hypothetical protein